MPTRSIRAGLGGAILAAALVLAPTVPAQATTPLPAVGGSSGVIENRPIGIALLNREGTGEVLTYSVATPPRHGTAVVIGPTASTILYTPDLNYVGDDSFTYTETDGVSISAPGLMELTVTPSGLSAPGDPMLPTPRSTAVPPGGVDGDATSTLTISGQDFIDAQPDGRSHVLPVGADVIEGYDLGGAYLFEDVSRNAYEPVQMSALFTGPSGQSGGIALGAHPVAPPATAPAGAFSLKFSAFHSGCSQQPGTEDVQRFDVAANGDPVAIDITFAITCDADTVHAMTGRFHWRAVTGTAVGSAPEPTASASSSAPVSPVGGAAGATATTPTPSADPVDVPEPAPDAHTGSVGGTTEAPTADDDRTTRVPSSAPSPSSDAGPVPAATPPSAPTPHAVRKQRSRTVLQHVTRSHGRVRFAVAAGRAAPGASGWKPWASATVRIEERTSHGWHVLAAVRTSAKGTGTVSLRAPQHRWRAVTTGTSAVTGSTSPIRTR